MKRAILFLISVLLLCSLISCNSQIEESDISSQPNDISNIGGSIPDTEFRYSFILLSNTLSNIINLEKLPEWENRIEEISSAKNKDPYLYDNIYEFIRFFEIPREEFEDLYYSTDLYYMYDYNFDLLYSDDIDKVYDYYKKANDDFTKRNNELLIKQDLRNYIGQEQFNNWLYDTKPQKYNNYFDVSWSIAEVIYNFDIPRQVVEKIIDNHKSYRDEVTIEEEFEDGSKALIFDNKLLYEYDLDMIYDKNHKITELIDLGKQGYIIDEMIHK